MLKHAFRIVGLFVVVSLAILVVSQRLSVVKLQTDLQSLREQSERLPEPATENAGSSNPNEQTTQPEIRPSEPSLELLRLRGEVGLLRREHNEAEQLRNENERLRQEIRAMRGPTLNEMYGMRGLETNSLPEVETGAMNGEVLVELRRVGARVLEYNEKFIHAEVYPALRSSTNGALATITMEFYFHESKLVSRKDTPKGIPPWPPNPFE